MSLHKLYSLAKQPGSCSTVQLRNFYKSPIILQKRFQKDDQRSVQKTYKPNHYSQGDSDKSYNKHDYFKGSNNFIKGRNASQKKNYDKPSKKKKKPLDFSGYPNLFKLVYETKKFAIVNKSPGLDVQKSRPSGGSMVAPGLFTILIKINPFLKNVHRIDKFVGGGILLSKGKTAAKMFSRNLRFGGLKGYPLTRRYVAKVPIGEIAKSEAVTMFNENVGVINTESQGKISRTKFIRTSVTDGNFQLFVLELETGRKHQIREHLSTNLGLPVFNDKLHGSQDLMPDNIDAIGLHSSYIGVVIGLQKDQFIIPVHFVKEVWANFVDEEGNFNEEIQTTLREFDKIYRGSIPEDQVTKHTTRITTKMSLL